MATANPTPADRGEDNFVLELRRVREQIKQKFTELIDCVKVRESELLKELDSILASYNRYRNEVDHLNEKKRELVMMQNDAKGKTEIKNAFLKTIQEKYLKEIGEELKLIQFPTEPKMVQFVSDNNRMFAELNKLGELVEKVRSVDYKSKVHPVVSVCQKGKGMEQLNYPFGVTVDNKTGNIYVVDQLNHCVKVFDNSGKILLKFGDSIGEGKMEFGADKLMHPLDVKLSKEYISILDESNPCLHLYSYNLVLQKSVISIGNGMQVFSPLCFFIDNSYNFIISGWSSNSILIFNPEFELFNKINTSTDPTGVVVDNQGRVIVVLQADRNCLQIF